MLARIPFWGWLLLIVGALYLVYNPLGWSLWHVWMDALDPSTMLPFRILFTIVLLSFLGLITHGVVNSTSLLGAIVMVALVSAVLWSSHALIAFNILSFGFWSWALQPILGLIMTVSWQWPKIWRRSTGAVSVNDPDTPV